MNCLPCRLLGPVDAAYKAIDSLVRVDVELVDYSVNSVSEGIEALATTRVIIRPSGKLQAISDHASLGKVQRTFSGEGAERRGKGREGGEEKPKTVQAISDHASLGKVQPGRACRMSTHWSGSLSSRVGAFWPCERLSGVW